MKKFILFLIIMVGVILGLGYRIDASAGPSTTPSDVAKSNVKNSKASAASSKSKAVDAKANAAWGTDLSLPKGTLIEILKYEATSDTFVIQSVAFPGEGESWVVPEALARAWKHEALEQMKKSPESLVGQQFQLNAELPTLFPNEIKARKAR